MCAIWTVTGDELVSAVEKMGSYNVCTLMRLSSVCVDRSETCLFGTSCKRRHCQASQAKACMSLASASLPNTVPTPQTNLHRCRCATPDRECWTEGVQISACRSCLEAGKARKPEARFLDISSKAHISKRVKCPTPETSCLHAPPENQ